MLHLRAVGHCAAHAHAAVQPRDLVQQREEQARLAAAHAAAHADQRTLGDPQRHCRQRRRSPRLGSRALRALLAGRAPRRRRRRRLGLRSPRCAASAASAAAISAASALTLTPAAATLQHMDGA